MSSSTGEAELQVIPASTTTPETREARQSRRILILVILLAIMAAAVLEFVLINFTVDDPLISARFAASLVDGHGLVYNAGERVEGYSSLLWVLVLAAGMMCGVGRDAQSILIFAKIVGAAASLVNIAIVATISIRLARNEGRSPDMTDAVAVALTATSPWFVLWAVGGLETQLYTMLVLCAAYFYFFHEIPLSAMKLRGVATVSYSSLCYALAGLTRPEFFFLYGAATVHRIWLNRRNREPVRRLISWAVPMIAILLPYLLWRHHYYGYWLPNTVYAKTSGGVAQLAYGAFYLTRGLASSGWALIAFLVVIPLLQRTTQPWYTLSLLMVAAQSLFIVLAGGDWMYGFRMFVPMLPFAALCLQYAAAPVLRDILSSGRNVGRARGTRAVLIAVGVASLAAQAITGLRSVSKDCSLLRYYTGGRPAFFSPSRYQAAVWLRDNLPEGSVVATGECGLIPYVAGFRVVDCFGLMDEHIGHLRGRMNVKFDVDYVLQRKPDYLLLFYDEDQQQHISTPYPYVRKLLASARVREEYRLVKQFDGIGLYQLLDHPGGNHQATGSKRTLDQPSVNVP